MISWCGFGFIRAGKVVCEILQNLRCGRSIRSVLEELDPGANYAEISDHHLQEIISIRFLEAIIKRKENVSKASLILYGKSED